METQRCEEELIMIPGPVHLSEEIMTVLSKQPPVHYGANWATLYKSSQDRICRQLGADGLSFLIPGSGSLGLEAAAASFCRDKKCLVLSNGWFGKRIEAITRCYSYDTVTVDFRAGEEISLEKVDNTLREDRYDVVFVVHVETSTGMLNPITEIAEIAKKSGAIVLVDAVASAGIEEIDMKAQDIDVLISASQKGYECPPGLAIIALSNKAYNSIDDQKQGGSWYTNLARWKEYYKIWNDWHPFPVTLPTNTIVAIHKILESLEESGFNNKYHMSQRASRALQLAFEAMKISRFNPNGTNSVSLSAFDTESDFIPSKLVEYVLEKYNVRIAGSLGQIKDRVFRVGHMSKVQCQYDSLERLVRGVHDFVKSFRDDIPSEKAVIEILRSSYYSIGGE